MFSITSIIARLKTWAIAAGIVLAVIGVAFLKGRAPGKQSYQDRRMKDRQAAIRKSQEIENDVANDSRDDLLRRARRWLPDNDR